MVGAVARALLLLLFCGPVVAVDFTPHGTQPVLSQEIFSGENCSGCHGASSAAERAYSPWHTWAGTMKAHAGRDPLFWAALDVANRDAADMGMPGVGDFCLRCHAPKAWYAGRVAKNGTPTPTDGTDGCQLIGDHDDSDFSDFDGVTCMVCHRQAKTGPNGETARLENGNLWIDDSGQCDTNGDGIPDDGEPCRIGPYRYPDPQFGTPPHAAKYSSLVKEGRMCGVCHDVTSPITDVGPVRTLILADGTDTGIPFPIERTYSEWRNSDFGDTLFVDGFAHAEPAGDQARYGDTCQSCHMRQATDPAARASVLRPPGSRFGDMGVHELAGANVWMLGVIRTLYGSVLGRTDQIDRTIQLTEEILTQRTATVAITLGSLPAAGSTLPASVRITNLSGHKLPTGYSEGRRMWLEVEARDANGAVFWRSNPYDAATGALAIDRDDAVYEVKQGIWTPTPAPGSCATVDGSGRPTFHFVRNNCIAKDNRIPPRGFSGGNNLELQPIPVGRYPETAPGSGQLVHWDDRAYAIPVPVGTALPVTVQARLRMQIASREYLEFLRDQAAERGIPSENAMCAPDRPPLNTGPRDQTRGAFAYSVWEASGRSPPVDVATASRSSAP
jgi:hypothetical protein